VERGGSREGVNIVFISFFAPTVSFDNFYFKVEANRMGTRENKVETYLRDQVKLLGGDTRKWVSPGRDGVTDQLVFIGRRIILVEVKTSCGKLSVAQLREHVRLRVLGAPVVTVYGKKGVDEFVNDIFNHKLSEEYAQNNT